MAEGLTFWDAHIHMQPWWTLPEDTRRVLRMGHPDFATYERWAKDPEAFLRFLDEQGCEGAWIVNYVSPSVMGFTDAVNEYVLQFCAADPARLIPVGGVHPRETPNPVDRLRELYEKGLRIVKLHPPHMLLHANDFAGIPVLREIYAFMAEHRMVLLVHTGTSIFPRARNRFGRPMDLEDIGIDFPEITVILAHAGRPLWCPEAYFLVRRFSQFYVDISGIPPRRLLEYLPDLEKIADRVLFGSDFPGPGVPEPRENVEALSQLPLRPETQRKVFRENAHKLMKRLGIR